MRSTHLLGSILFLSSLLLMGEAFAVSVGAAAECSPFNVSWTGGQSPFDIYIFAVWNASIFYPVPSTAYSGNQGSFTIPQFPLPQGEQFVLTMSDATGFATGGTTNLIEVGGSTSNSSCNAATSLGSSFTFAEASSSLQQCSPYIFNGYQGAILPVTIAGIIPGGESFLIQSGLTATNYTWTADVQAETSIIFAMWDANGNTGGCTGIETVGDSNNASCLSSSSPSSTTSIPQSSQSGTSSASSSQPSSSSSTTLSTAAITGVVGGGVVALVALMTFGLCLVRRRRKKDSTSSVPTPHNAPLHLGDLDHGSDTSTTAHVSPFPYQSDHIQAFVPSDRTIQKMTQLAPEDICGFQRAPTNPQQDSSADTAGIPSVPLFAGSTARDNIVHMDEEHAPPTTSQVTDPPPSYSEIAGPPEHQSPSREGMGGV